MASADGVFHLMSDIQQLEIVEFAQDVPVKGNETGRLVFTSHGREGHSITRYDIGDSGRWVDGACACGLRSPRFELLQRHGKLIRIGSDFISLSELTQRLQVPFQLVLDHAPDGRDRLQLRSELTSSEVLARLADYSTLTTLIESGLLVMEVEVCVPGKFTRNAHSGKTAAVIDARR